jgi:vancomycin permeability regulator SanA
MTIIKRILLAIVIAAALAFGAAVVTYETIPRGNTQQSRFDAIIVLGYPANADGSPSLIQRERVLEAVREYRASVAPQLIMTGGAAHNSQVEAAVMARFAEAQGVPLNAVFEEPRAHFLLR